MPYLLLRLSLLISYFCLTALPLAASDTNSPLARTPGTDITEQKAQKTLTIHVTSICPFQCLPSEYEGNRGLFYDISALVFKASGYQLQPVYAPFSRAIILAQQGKLDIITTFYKDEIGGLLYPGEHIRYAREVFFVRSDDPWHYQGISSLRELQAGGDRILVSQDYDYGDSVFNQMIRDNPDLFLVLGGGNPFERAIQLLLKKRVRVAVFDQSVMAYTLARLQLTAKVRAAGAIHRGKKLYIGISAKKPQAGKIVAIFDAGLKQFKASERYRQLLEKYQLEEF